MEAIVYILIFIVGVNIAWSIIVGIFSAIFGGDDSHNNHTSASPLSVSLIQEYISTKDTELDCFTFKIKGKIGNPTGAPVKVIIRLSDQTVDKKLAALYAIPSMYQADSTGIFGICETLPAADPTTYFPEFVSMGSVPKALLQYPYKGNRTIKASLFLVDAACNEYSLDSIRDNLIEFTSSTTPYKISDIGYMDNYENRDRTNELSIDLCMLMAASDGALDQSEINAIKDWAKLSYILIEDESEKKIQKDKVSACIKNSYAKSKNKELDKDSLLEEINDIFDTTAKYNLIELLLNIAGADDLFAKEEEVFLNSITKSLSLDQSEVNEMKNKVVLSVKSIESTESSNESLLGLTNNMSNNEKRKSLRESYSKWSSQTTHKDPKIKQRANEMVEIIAKLNIKYKN